MSASSAILGSQSLCPTVSEEKCLVMKRHLNSLLVSLCNDSALNTDLKNKGEITVAELSSVYWRQ